MILQTRLSRFAAIALLLASTSRAAMAQAEDHSVEAEAGEAVERFFAAWDSVEIEDIRDALVYPHISLYGPEMAIAESREQFDGPIDTTRSLEGRAESTIASIAFGLVSAEKANCTVEYFRERTENRYKYWGQMALILLKRDGEWRIQFRALLEPDSSAEAESIAAARKVLDEFFMAFNKSDNARLQALSNYPHAFIMAEGKASISKKASELVTNFDAMRANERWHSSTLDSAVPSYASKTQVHFDVVFSRLRADGTIYRSVPATWIVTNKNGHWGLQVRSLMPATVSID